MNETSEEKCPKCGSDRASQFLHWFLCDSIYIQGRFIQSEQCKGRQLDEALASVAALTEKLEAASRERDDLREVWFVADQTIGCHFCGWIDWPGVNGETDGTTKPHPEECPIGYMQTHFRKELAAANKEVERLKELVFAVKETLHPQAWKYHQPSHSPPITARFFDLNEALIKVCGPNWESEHEAAAAALLAPSEAKEGSDAQ